MKPVKEQELSGLPHHRKPPQSTVSQVLRGLARQYKANAGNCTDPRVPFITGEKDGASARNRLLRL